MNNLVVQFIFNTEWAYRAHATLIYRGSIVPESTSDTWIRQYLTLFIHSLVVHVNTEKMSRKQHGLFLLHKVTTRLETRSQTMLSSQQVSPMCSCIFGTDCSEKNRINCKQNVNRNSVYKLYNFFAIVQQINRTGELLMHYKRPVKNIREMAIRYGIVFL